MINPASYGDGEDEGLGTIMPMGKKKRRECEVSLSRTDARVKTKYDVWHMKEDDARRNTMKTAQVNMTEEILYKQTHNKLTNGTHRKNYCAYQEKYGDDSTG